MLLSNHCENPLVTVNLVAHDGDIQYLPRAVKSILAQNLPRKQIQVLVAYDGMPGAKALKILGAQLDDHPFHSVFVLESPKTGYYCVPRNRALSMPMNFGLYQANLDVDNEWKMGHLSGLLEAIRTPDPEDGWPHFVYSRREYVVDEGTEPGKLPTGPSTFVPWTQDSAQHLCMSPQNNFVDTSDFLISKSGLFRLGEVSGCAWNSEQRRFGDWELMTRLAKHGFRGRAVDQTTHIYHWTGKNVQLTRPVEEVKMLPAEVYERMREQGLIIAPGPKDVQ